MDRHGSIIMNPGKNRQDTPHSLRCHFVINPSDTHVLTTRGLFSVPRCPPFQNVVDVEWQWLLESGIVDAAGCIRESPVHRCESRAHSLEFWVAFCRSLLSATWPPTFAMGFWGVSVTSKKLPLSASRAAHLLKDILVISGLGLPRILAGFCVTVNCKLFFLPQGMRFLGHSVTVCWTL